MTLGVALGGGGAKGAYQVGVFGALAECGLWDKVSCVSGTSVGALNALLFAKTSAENAERIWLKMTFQKMFDTTEVILDKTRRLQGLVQRLGRSRGIVEAVDQIVTTGAASHDDFLARFFRDEGIDFTLPVQGQKALFATCCEKSVFLTPHYFCLNGHHPSEIENIILASASLPLMFSCRAIEGKHYLDGGTRDAVFHYGQRGMEGADNVPVLPLVRSGCDVVIAVKLSGEKLDLSRFSKTTIIEIEPAVPFGGPFTVGDFSETQQKIRMGYADTLARLKVNKALLATRKITPASAREVIAHFNTTAVVDKEDASMRKAVWSTLAAKRLLTSFTAEDKAH